MTREDIADELSEVLEDIANDNIEEATMRLLELYDRMVETPADIRAENDGFWW